jgi:para-nitrobenzyl esterase
VWIHGGGLRNGAGSDFDMSRFAAEQRVIVVTPNYRLGAFGFLDLPGLEGGGQFGLLDQQAALRWVRNNIEAVGGDPERVTLAGESGGADAVCAQLASPEGSGLFQRAIVQSGTCSDTNILDVVIPGAGPAYSTWKSPEVAHQVGDGLAVSVGCNVPEEAAGCLRERPVGDILQAAQASGAYFSPTVGSGILPRHPAEVAADERRDTGWTRDEGNIFATGFAAQPLTEQSFSGLLALAAGEAAPEALAAYQRTGDVTWNRLWAEVITDRGWTCPNIAVDEAFAESGAVFAYEFADPTAPSPLVTVPEELADGTLHGAELAYLFELDPGQPELTQQQRELAREMRDAWGLFVRTGEPGDWPELGAEGEVRVFAPDGVEAVPVAEIQAQHHCAVWSK